MVVGFDWVGGVVCEVYIPFYALGRREAKRKPVKSGCFEIMKLAGWLVSSVCNVMSITDLLASFHFSSPALFAVTPSFGRHCILSGRRLGDLRRSMSSNE